MNNSNFSKAISEALTEEYVFSIPEHETTYFQNHLRKKCISLSREEISRIITLLIQPRNVLRALLR